MKILQYQELTPLRRSYTIRLSALIALTFVIVICVEEMRQMPTPPVISGFKTEGELTNQIVSLPVLHMSDDFWHQRKWFPYIKVAERLKLTSDDIVEKGFQHLATRTTDSESIKKVVILIQISFVGTSSEDLNNFDGPIGCALGRFYLKEENFGFIGTPYDPASVYRWRKFHGQWRQ